MTCCKYYAGMLTSDITVLRPKDVADGYGGHSTQWQEAQKVKAHVKEVNGKKTWAQDRLAAVKTYEITVRADCCIEAFCRLIYKCVQLRIVGVVEPARGWVVITAESGVV